MRQAHRSVCHKHIDLFYPYVPQRNSQGSSLPTALAGITISLTVSQFAHLPFISIPLALSLVSSALRKERQTHFHTNGVRACSPGTQWNCKYFIFAWQPCAITAWPLSPLFHSVSSLTFFLFFALICTHLRYPPMLTLTLCASIYHLVSQITDLIEKHPQFFFFTALQPFTNTSVQSKITLLQS